MLSQHQTSSRKSTPKRQSLVLTGLTIFAYLSLLIFTPVSFSEEDYIYRTGSFDGIGKFYMGREISHVMGHLGAAWLERTSREQEEQPLAVINNMNLSADSVIADIGAGTGYFAFRIAKLVPKGKVMAVDIQPQMLTLLSEKAKRLSMTNVVPHLGKIDHVQLPSQSIDAALMVDAYHEFSHPKEMLSSLYLALKPGGKIFLVEYRGEDPSVPIKPLHKMTQTQAKKEFSAAGLRFVETKDFLPSQHFMIFEKP